MLEKYPRGAQERKNGPQERKMSPKSKKNLFSAGYANPYLYSVRSPDMSKVWPNYPNKLLSTKSLRGLRLTRVGMGTPAHCLRFANPSEATTNPANMARISTKLRQNAFRTICNFRFFDTKKIFRKFFRFRKAVFRNFRQILEELGSFWRQNLIPGGILLQIVKFSGL